LVPDPRPVIGATVKEAYPLLSMLGMELFVTVKLSSPFPPERLTVSSPVGWNPLLVTVKETGVMEP
jgi:hypothetical protein